MAGNSVQKLSLFALTAMVVGSMVGAGIFSLPRTFGNATGPFGAIIAWCIAGAGMFTLARVFRVLAERKPHLDAGVYAYAKAGFGDYAASCRLLAIGWSAVSRTFPTGC
jgi:arginine:ornithine antiporter/lysine permease